MSHRFCFGDLSIFLECRSPHSSWPRDLAYLVEFLSPVFRVEAADVRADGEPSVQVVVDDEAYATVLAERTTKPLTEQVCFVLDQSELTGSEWRSGDIRCVADESHGVVYAISGDRQVTLVSPRTGALRRALMRVIREIAQAAVTSTSLILHASAALWSGTGIVIAGPKRSGKTSLLIYLLSRGASYLANDRVVVDAGSFEIRGLPTLISIREGCLELFPTLRAELAKTGFRSHVTIAEAIASPPRPARKPEVSPAQLCLLTGATMTDRASLDVVLIPNANPTGPRFDLRRLSGSEALARLPEVRFGTRHPGRISAVFGGAAVDETSDPAGSIWRDCVQRVPVVECRLGSFDPELNQDFLDRVRDLIARPETEVSTIKLTATHVAPSTRRLEHQVMVCAIVKDEAANLVEWIEFHRLLGVTFFAIYDNGSSDDISAVLASYIREGLVELVSWPEYPGQLSAYEDCVRRHRATSQWIAFLDLDEFLVPPFGESLPGFLALYEGSNGLGVNWLVFGSSGHKTRSRGLMIESYLQRTDESHPDNRHIKTIADPRRVVRVGVNPHYFVYQDGGSVLDERFDPIPIGAFSRIHRSDRIRINHYFTRSEEEFARKLARGRATTAVPRGTALLSPAKLAPLSRTRDDRMLQYVEILRERIAARRRSEVSRQ